MLGLQPLAMRNIIGIEPSNVLAATLRSPKFKVCHQARMRPRLHLNLASRCAKAWAICRVSSVDPSSHSTHSQSANVCRRNESNAGRNVASALYIGTRIEISGTGRD